MTPLSYTGTSYGSTARIRATDLPAIADALGISVDQLIDHAKKK